MLLSQLVVLATWLWFIVRYEVPLNVRMINEDGSADTLWAGFHERRGWVRFWWWLALCTAGAACAWPHVGWAFAALGVLLAGVFFRTFGPLLSAGMKLAYKARFYASPRSKSFPDALVWWWVRRRSQGVADALLQQKANEVNQALLNWVGLACLAAYAYFTVRLLGAGRFS